jgi:hypothetical protein
VGTPKGGVDDGRRIACSGSPDGNITNGSRASSLKYHSDSWNQYTEKGGICPESDGVTKTRVSALQ